MTIYNDKEIERSFSDPDAHKQASNILFKHSTNKLDIREFALKGVDLSRVKNILDIGCGFGFFTLGLKGKIKKGAHIVGLDRQEAYRNPFIEACHSIGAIGEFHISDALELVTYPPHSFDLALSSYSLYFFPGIIKHIAQVLTKNGMFIAITHSQRSLSELITHLPKAIKSVGLSAPELLSIQRLFREFSFENGEKLLKPYFADVTTRPYKNSIKFTKKDIRDIETYLKMHKRLLLKEVYDNAPDSLSGALNHLITSIISEAGAKGVLEFNKDDAAFICERPTVKKKRTFKPPAKKYCIACGKPLAEKIIEGRKRNVCPNCGYIVYENPLPVVSALVANDNGEVLLVKRARQPMKGMWCLPAGFAEADENIEQATLRELEEETGIQGKIKRVIHVETAQNYFYGNLVMIAFEIERTGGVLHAGDDATDAKFFPLNRLPPLAFMSHDHVIEKYLESTNK